jgi:hypothetical protein
MRALQRIRDNPLKLSMVVSGLLVFGAGLAVDSAVPIFIGNILWAFGVGQIVGHGLPVRENGGVDQ